MLKEALAFIADLAHGKILEAHGKAYSRHNLTELPGPKPIVVPMTVHSLSGFSDYVEGAEAEHQRSENVALIVNPCTVLLLSRLFGDWKQRDVFVKAEPFLGKGFSFGRYLNVEDFTVGLQTNFVEDDHTAAILKMIGNIQAGLIKTVVDDGVSQEVTVRKGITKVDHAVVVSPVELRPFRTFQDIEQPSSKYILRLRRENEDGMPQVALFEVDDNLWQLTAVRSIKEYLDEALPDVLVLA